MAKLSARGREIIKTVEPRKGHKYRLCSMTNAKGVSYQILSKHGSISTWKIFKENMTVDQGNFWLENCQKNG